MFNLKDKKYIFIIIFIIISLISCKKINILSPNKIPPPTDFRIPDKLKPVSITVSENNNDESLVFGGFQKKFFFRGKWYILAQYSYTYDKNMKQFNYKDHTLILELDNDGKINIVAKNLGTVETSPWNYLYQANVINDDEIIFEPYNYGELKCSKETYKYFDKALNKDVNIEYYKELIYPDIYYRSTDLLNWQKYGQYHTYMNLPSPTQLDSSKPKSWQGRFGLANLKMALVGDYIYLYDLRETFYEENPDGSRILPDYTVSKDKYYRIHRDKDMSDPNNWEEVGKTPWGNVSDFEAKYNDGKFYLENGKQCMYKKINNVWTLTPIKNNDKWVTENFIDWQKFNGETPKDIDSYVDDFHGDLGIVKKRDKTPTPPNWVEYYNKVYYQTYNTYMVTYDFNRYFLPIPPINEIKAALNRGETDFVIKPEHVKNAGKNLFMVTDVDPRYAKESDWSLLTPINYDEKSIIWHSGKDTMLFNINNKIIQLVDYTAIKSRIQNYTIYYQVINELMMYYRNYYRNGNYYESMYYKAQADMLQMMMKNPETYLLPDEPVESYTIEFKYHFDK
ncbi:hypothetical protein BRSU_0572 [Brachyspira suanatina]|uniref:Uncharacterized protein n=1 Tax=Brachyspira suanatina TaxID=381802 RepID=A0A0G4K4K3_9SPIR|nr:hypothetical protein [Brachyspira suanatina]CRF32098.1 hypothetical protein BRSU_0572 [Brachyspira suanatina]